MHMVALPTRRPTCANARRRQERDLVFEEPRRHGGDAYQDVELPTCTASCGTLGMLQYHFGHNEYIPSFFPSRNELIPQARTQIIHEAAIFTIRLPLDTICGVIITDRFNFLRR